MHELMINEYITLSILIAFTDILLAWKSFRKNNTTGKYLGFACVGAAIVDISYLVSILNDSYLCMSIMSSIYFASIDVMLVCLLIFTLYFTKRKFSKTLITVLRVISLYVLFEIIVFAINPFFEIAIHYIPRNTIIAKYSYDMLPLYWMHLIFSYALVISVLVLLVQKLFVIPKEYRGQYRYVIIGIVAIVLVNAFFLFWPGVHVYNLLDYSICGYSLTAFLLYWSCFNYSTHGMLNHIKNIIFENIDQGLVLFDYDNNLILHNQKADHLLGSIDLKKCANMEDFLNTYDLSFGEDNSNISQQCYIKNGQEDRSLRCDIRRLKGEKQKTLGQLFVFSDAVLETDVLTGFQNWESFRRFVSDGLEHFPQPTAVAICDINSLSVINSTLGNNAGDQKIHLLADTMREYFPKQTYFVRGHEANLIALCGYSSEAEMQKYLTLVDTHFEGKIQYALSVTSKDTPDILQAIQVAVTSMRAKKLLDQESIHSEMLTSLIRALEECDSDTEHHVRRTQQMGADLGKRIGLNDVQQSKLSLLCLLHDIGKIGVPLEILNKPGKLSDAEWTTLRSHAKKGYEIANSNNELKEIADEILHHHERWDGNGYPDGLSCESIPLLSRVIAVVDAYDAMTNNRSYRPAMSVASAVQELKKCAGSQFDPYIVSEFIQMLRENPGYRSVYSNIANDDSGIVVNTTLPSEPQEAHSVHPIPYSRYILDESMKIISVDKNFEKMTGYTAEYIAENSIYQKDLIPEDDRTEYLCQTNARLANNPIVFQEHKLLRKDGSEIYVFCCGRVYFDSAVRAARSEIIIADVSNTYSMKMMTYAEQTKAQARLRYWERTYRRDSLTGLLRHAAFRSDVELKLLEGNTAVMMLMIDVDHFKEYNDSHGHHEGDKYLVLVAQSLLSSLRKQDRAGRMGGDEFAAVLFFDKETDTKQMQELAHQIFDNVNACLKTLRKECSISMGAVISNAECTFNQMYEEADQALYQAKNHGRGRLFIS